MTSVDLTDRTIIITGGNSGIGREAAVALAGLGATVVITSRRATRGEEAVADIRRRSGNDRAEVMALDLADFASVRTFAAQALDRFPRIDVLINNAGAIISERQVTAQGFELTFGANHLGPFLLTSLLLDRLRGSAPSRVVNVASIAHRFAPGGLRWSDLQAERRYRGATAYNGSKLANILFTRALAERLAGSGVTANACHPGPVRTGFGGAEDTTGLERVAMVLAKPFLIGARRGSLPLVHLAASPDVEGVTGQYFARWPTSSFPGARIAPHRPSRAARDPAAAAQLWDVSESLIASVDA